MKQIITFIFTLPLLFFMLSCSDDSDILSPIAELKYRVIAYKSLTDKQKESITPSWKEAYVEEGIYQTGNCTHLIILDSKTKLCFNLKDESTPINLNQTLVAVSFGTKNVTLLGPLTLIINPNNDNVIGAVGRN
ncbi:hypothetical protein MNBD_IGNAVI01-522 [hydrothermal vent metagenome]|uniref:Uncharacterized protein n=1 Tax=hydrothermal vent metagenome TaxID=652676 RepID=A0A3B1C6Y3_9ZZZZ